MKKKSSLARAHLPRSERPLGSELMKRPTREAEEQIPGMPASHQDLLTASLLFRHRHQLIGWPPRRRRTMRHRSIVGWGPPNAAAVSQAEPVNRRPGGKPARAASTESATLDRQRRRDSSSGPDAYDQGSSVARMLSRPTVKCRRQHMGDADKSEQPTPKHFPRIDQPDATDGPTDSDQPGCSHSQPTLLAPFNDS